MVRFDRVDDVAVPESLGTGKNLRDGSHRVGQVEMGMGEGRKFLS